MMPARPPDTLPARVGEAARRASDQFVQTRSPAFFAIRNLSMSCENCTIGINGVAQ